jgi:hypothetical protein
MVGMHDAGDKRGLFSLYLRSKSSQIALRNYARRSTTLAGLITTTMPPDNVALLLQR